MILSFRRTALVVLAFLGLSGTRAAAAPVAVPAPLEKAVPKIEVTFDPPTARPGQTVTWRLTMDIAPGWHTYPSKQPEKEAEAFHNEFLFPTDGDVVFVGTLQDPANPKTKFEGEGLESFKVNILEGKAVWERPAVVRPQATPGDKTVTVGIKASVCDANKCLPQTELKPSAVLKVTDASAVPVDPKYRDDPALKGRATPTPPSDKPKLDGLARKLAELIDIKASVTPPEARPGEVVKLTLTGTLKPGYHTYPVTKRTKQQDQLTQISYPPSPGLKPLWPITESEGEFKKEADGTVLLEHAGKVTWSQDILVLPDAAPGPHPLKVKVRLQICDKNTCTPVGDYPELEATINVKGESVPLSDALKKRMAEGPPPVQVVSPPAGPKGGAFAKAERTRNNIDLLSFILTGALMGIVSLFTPCVFPMIPITVSFFIKQSERKPAIASTGIQTSPGRPAHHSALTLALVYSGTIVVVLTIGAMLLLGFFQAATQFWVTNLILAVLFVVFALSLFGMYDITLPSGLANYTSSQQGRGGLAGTVFMALTFAIISFSCVAPFLGGFAALVPSFGDVIAMLKAGDFGLLGGLLGTLLLGALAFSVCFAAPFFFLALFPSLLRALPKSGSWMNTVKVVMGFIELAAAVKFLRAAELTFTWANLNFLTYDLALGIYVALCICCGLYLLNLFRLPHDEPPEHLGVPRLLFGVLFLALGLYLAPGLFKTSSGESQRPTGAVFAWLDSFLLPDEPDTGEAGGATAQGQAEGGQRLAWIGNFETGLKQAERDKRLLFIDFTGKT